MVVQIKKPILVIGVSVSFLLWFWQSFQSSLAQIGEFSLWGLVGLGIVFWFWQPQKKHFEAPLKLYTPISEGQLHQAISAAEALIQTLAEETQKCPTQPSGDRHNHCLEQNYSPEITAARLEEIKKSQHRSGLQVAIAGDIRSGKSTLLDILERAKVADEVYFSEVKVDLSDEPLNNIINNYCLQADLLLFIINGDLTESQLNLLEAINAQNQRLLLIFNQKDRYLPEEQNILLRQLQARVKAIIAPEDTFAIATSPAEIKVKKYHEDGSFQEWLEKPPAEFNQLVECLVRIVSQEKSELILATTYRKVIALQGEIRREINNLRRQQALPLIERYQWMAAGAAFANPVSSLDLLATAAINTQMLVDLSNIYRQKFALAQVQNASVAIAKMMVKLGIVEISTQTITNILKTNAFTYIAGGVVQGISAAYLTRIGGLSLIAYLEVEKSDGDRIINIDRLKEKVAQIFQENQKTILWQNFVNNAIKRLSTSSP